MLRLARNAMPSNAGIRKYKIASIAGKIMVIFFFS